MASRAKAKELPVASVSKRRNSTPWVLIEVLPYVGAQYFRYKIVRETAGCKVQVGPGDLPPLGMVKVQVLRQNFGTWTVHSELMGRVLGKFADKAQAEAHRNEIRTVRKVMDS